MWGMRVVAVTLVVFEGLRGRLKMHFKLSSECFRGLRQGEECGPEMCTDSEYLALQRLIGKARIPFSKIQVRV